MQPCPMMRRRVSPSCSDRTMDTSSQPPQPQRASAARLYSIAMLVGFSLLQLVPQFSVVGNLRNRPNEGIEQSGAAATGTHVEQPLDTSKEFDYAAFWEKAMKEAHESLKSEVSPSSAPCPKVYVYDLPSNLIDSFEKHQFGFGREVSLKDKNDKKKYQGYLYETDQYAFPSILEERLRQSEMCRTTKPDEADLFFAPILPSPKTGKLWNSTCREINADMVRNALPHLNESNACRHFFAIGKGHYNAEPCEGWYYNPIAEFKPFLRLAYTNYTFLVDSKGAHDYDPNDTTRDMYPNLFSVPYPSSLHFRSAENDMNHWKEMNKRKVLMSFVGKDYHGDVQVRQRIHKSCDKYKDKKVCEYIERFKPDLMTAKGKAIFCLEPAGDSPWRKSLSDSIAFGCIPVLFSELTDNVTPWFWNDWKARGRVLVPRDEFVAGRIDLKKLLQSMPPRLLELMQTTIKEKARRYQYSLDEDQEDGIRITLDNLRCEALDMERRGVCGYKK